MDPSSTYQNPIRSPFYFFLIPQLRCDTLDPRESSSFPQDHDLLPLSSPCPLLHLTVQINMASLPETRNPFSRG